MRSQLVRLASGRDGVTAIEYAMVAFFISAAAFGVILRTGGAVTDLFGSIAAGF